MAQYRLDLELKKHTREISRWRPGQPEPDPSKIPHLLSDDYSGNLRRIIESYTAKLESFGDPR